ncbi:exodeoxyribonuclease VII small subunit [Thermotomaculum hydrothermale]|uniref:Exodeoxyribonuclease 7 small subunit n=1 Tax=Thermotomaculum hydrothermale TaxID=981385 RepID=A0A7R6PNQ7_9BACT|nr:exodeoxyribonuclease VII small subunit [Thermotomaculum hydrothermale]BBB32451.1 exodeoxyribonuclease VII small subunit [Thermotomaculum hydrothermale]
MAKFEEKLKRLEEIVETLSSPELELDTSLKLFEEGVKLVRELNSELKDARGKVIEFQKYLEEIEEDGQENAHGDENENDEDVPF